MRVSGRLNKIIAIICFLSITISLWLAHSSPVHGYEPSLYDSTPWQVWLLLFIGFIGGIYIVFDQVFTKRYLKSRMWVMGLSILVFSKATLLVIPYVRSYLAWGGDHLTHIGHIRDIIISGHFSPSDYYPIAHLLSFSYISITGADLFSASLLTVLLSILFVVFTYLLATAIFSKRDQQIMATLFVSCIIVGGSYNVFLMPNGLSLFFLPLIFYLYFKNDTIQFKGLLLLLLAIYPLFHPLSALVVIMSIVILEILKTLVPHVLNRKSRPHEKLKLRPSATYALVGLVSFLPWVLSFQQFKINLHVMWNQITTGFAPDPVAEISGSFDKVQMAGFDVIFLFFKMYGPFVFLTILCIIGVYLVLFRDSGLNVLNIEKHRYLSLATIFLTMGTLYGAYLLGAPGLSALAGGRLQSYSEVIVPVLSASAVFFIIDRGRRRKLLVSLLAFTIILASLASIISLYPSPHIVRPNPQMAHADFSGMGWFIEEKNRTIDCAYILSPPSRLSDAILGTIEADERSDMSNRNAVQLSDHFGYLEYSSLGEQSLNDRYILLPSYDKNAYTTIWQTVDRFNTSDFAMLDYDMTVSRIYVNGGFDIYGIQG